MPEVDHVIGNAEKMQRRDLGGLSRDGSERVQVNDIMSVRETARAPDRRLRRRAPRLRADPERLRPPLHVLHHPLRPRTVALGAGRRGGRADPQLVEAGYAEVVLTGVDITRYGADLPGAMTLGTPRAPYPAAGAGAAAPAPVLHRPGRGRRRTDRRHRRRAAADAASASVAAGRRRLILKRMKRRHLARRRHRLLRRGARSCGPTSSSAPISSPASRPRPRPCSRIRSIWSTLRSDLLHVFPFSPRHGTPAARMPQVTGRWSRSAPRGLRARGAAGLASFISPGRSGRTSSPDGERRHRPHAAILPRSRCRCYVAPGRWSRRRHRP